MELKKECSRPASALHQLAHPAGMLYDIDTPWQLLEISTHFDARQCEHLGMGQVILRQIGQRGIVRSLGDARERTIIKTEVHQLTERRTANHIARAAVKHQLPLLDGNLLNVLERGYKGGGTVLPGNGILEWFVRVVPVRGLCLRHEGNGGEHKQKCVFHVRSVFVNEYIYVQKYQFSSIKTRFSLSTNSQIVHFYSQIVQTGKTRPFYRKKHSKRTNLF